MSGLLAARVLYSSRKHPSRRPYEWHVLELYSMVALGVLPGTDFTDEKNVPSPVVFGLVRFFEKFSR